MGMLCAVSFNRYGRLYYLNPGDFRPSVGDRVLVPTDDGPEVAECVWAPQWVDEDTDGFPRLAGIAGDEHMRRDELQRKRKAEENQSRGRVTAAQLRALTEEGRAQVEQSTGLNFDEVLRRVEAQEQQSAAAERTAQPAAAFP